MAKKKIKPQDAETDSDIDEKDMSQDENQENSNVEVAEPQGSVQDISSHPKFAKFKQGEE